MNVMRMTAMTMTMKTRWSIVQRKLEAAAESLGRQGSIVSRIASGRRVWSVRFVERDKSGRRVQRAVYVGGDRELVLNQANSLG